MKFKLLFLFFSIVKILTAQTFTEMTSTPFDGVVGGSIAFSDVNSDGHMDVLITGEISTLGRIAKLYTNDGTGIFTLKTGTPFDAVLNSSIAFSDVNGDGYEDVLITGENSSYVQIAKLYTNDGTGTFTLKAGVPFIGVDKGSIAFSDVNGDGHEDVLISGDKDFIEPIAKLYINNGTGTFTEKMGTPFDGVWYSSIAFSDVNGDGDNDVLITGENIFGEQISKLYSNDGTGNFTHMAGTPFDGVSSGSIAFSDVNGDGNEDVLITGHNNSLSQIAELYTNDGTGTFTQMTGTPFVGVRGSSIAFSDINGNSNKDVLITGRNNLGVGIAKLYTNDGTGNFNEIIDIPFDGVQSSSIAFSDVNNDGHDDVFITGAKGLNGTSPISKLYINNGVSSIKDLNPGISLDFLLFPNPTTSTSLSLTYDSPEMSKVSIKVYDANGSLLHHQVEYAAIGTQTYIVNIATLPKGNYFLELDNEKRKRGGKFVVQ